ncbi:membrane protein insertase YidC [Rossellomorea marisflavi]|uniref:membrane protein insertase YidC n=1 Tax=Rossellomorea marisflavi TaxID=189381 RepID=UPI0009A8A26F|nr:membrane protein insertase YidC [Rossellomorea marisflavi]MBV6685810.1 membrane protein insertase YidC [Bacillus sp. JRC01]MCM2589303.1 membrane protein insertase YidC [Rossellomorea marisflavi]UKS63657.1 membrane protein insertase YidC [Rossellomorea marisflavi]UTE74755.1 membrane protein insertase YidC [Rossellomorea marisflavi]GLI85533.1 membrane protein insertase YidC 1 [Rossellomorea marisflavi]
MKKLTISLLVLITAITLGGCQSATTDGAFFHDYFVNPFAYLIHEIGTFLGGNFGLALIVITILIRLILLPFMLRTYKNQQEMKVKMDVMKPEMTAIQKKIKETKNKEEQQKLQQEMMQLYQKHGVNPLNMGCLPLIIQTPILIGLYYAIRSSTEIADHSFLWFNLGEPNIAMAVIAGIVYLIQSRVTLIGMTPEQQKQMKILGLLSPVMIFIFSLNAPSALPLYWAAGGAFLIVQTLIGKKLYAPKAVEKEAKPAK